jgi:predicted MFS family arabinose efflux permease
MWPWVVTTIVRMVVNTAFRLFYPFVPELSREFGVSPEALTAAFSARGAVGLISPAVGAAADRLNRRTLMLLGLGGVGLALLLIGSTTSLAALAIGSALLAAAKLAYDLGVLAHIGDQTTYAQRGRVVGLSEMAWSGAALIGLPLVGLAIGRFGARTPFFVLAGLVAVGMLAIRFVVVSRPGAARHPSLPTKPRTSWRELIQLPSVLPMLGCSLLIPFGNEILNVIYGRWLESSFGLSVESIGASAIVLGVAELTGEAIIAIFSDRIGKRNLAILGALLGVVAYLALPLLSATGQIGLALLGIAGVYLGFEILVVGTLPILSELAPDARGAMLSTASAMQSAGRLFGSWVGLALFAAGIWPAALLAAFVNLTVSVILWRWARA